MIGEDDHEGLVCTVIRALLIHSAYDEEINLAMEGGVYGEEKFVDAALYSAGLDSSTKKGSIYLIEEPASFYFSALAWKYYNMKLLKQEGRDFSSLKSDFVGLIVMDDPLTILSCSRALEKNESIKEYKEKNPNMAMSDIDDETFLSFVADLLNEYVAILRTIPEYNINGIFDEGRI
ncbi:unnamed protein product, partial [marine sediment metagenome]